jgi:hypothetical protein
MFRSDVGSDRGGEIVKVLFLLQPVREPSMELRPAGRPLRLSFNDPAAAPPRLTPPAPAPCRRGAETGIAGQGRRRGEDGATDHEKVGRNDHAPAAAEEV